MPKKKTKTKKFQETRKADAYALAQLIFDIHQDKKRSTPDNRDKKEYTTSK